MLLINYKPVLRQPTGIGIYAKSVLPALQTFEHVLIPGGQSGGFKERFARLAWSQCKLPRLAKKNKADLIFTPAPEGYLGKQTTPQIVMVHDMRPLSHPELSIQSLYFRNWVSPLLKQCRHIITNSNFTATEICKVTGICEDKITVTKLGYDSDHFHPLDSCQRLHDRPYLLHVGQSYPHKNVERLITAFNQVAYLYPEVDLLLLGKPHPTETKRLQGLVSELGLSERVIFKSYVAYADLPNWYRGALAFVYPSLWEGFGLPILEAMACGAPTITSLGSATEEVAGTHATLINPFDTIALTQSIKDAVESPPSALTMDSAFQHARTYSWHSTREQTKDLFERLLAL